ncbi:MAG: hypothetical protein NC453_24705 [Muribaculum sp.]|nr:hypothetical protein [Muribaculum sp.]
MKLLCKILGCATILLGLYVWLQTPIAVDGATQPPTFSYTATAIGCIIGGFFWFVLGRIIENQESIMEHFNIHKPKK